MSYEPDIKNYDIPLILGGSLSGLGVTEGLCRKVLASLASERLRSRSLSTSSSTHERQPPTPPNPFPYQHATPPFAPPAIGGGQAQYWTPFSAASGPAFGPQSTYNYSTVVGGMNNPSIEVTTSAVARTGVASLSLTG